MSLTRTMTLAVVMLMLAAAAFAVDFGDSVTFDKNVPPLTMETLQGKVTLFLFFQSW